jgi:glucose/mannose-6-phosphate isomerase
MLDDENVVRQLDRSDALGLAAKTPEQLLHNFELQPIDIPRPIHAVVYSGMGGSALQAELATVFPRLAVPFVIVKNYDLPAFVNENTLVIAASYSGNTEETLSALAQARERGAMIAVHTGGGKLLEAAKEHGDFYVEVPKAVQPRMAVFYAYRILIETFMAYGLIGHDAIEAIEKAGHHLDDAVTNWQMATPLADNPAKQLALQLAGKTPIIYAGPKMAPAAFKWKISFNESSKNTSWYNVLPEFNHNEFMGWTSHPIEKPFAVLDLVSGFEHPRVLKRFEVGDRILSGMRPKAIRVEAQGESEIEQLLYMVLFGDFVSLYLGILNGVDPSPVALIEKFKIELG